MPSKITVSEQCALLITAYSLYITMKSKARLLEPTIFGEPFAKKLVEIVFGYPDLINLNEAELNHAAIDLATAGNEAAFQVTITGSSTKIEDSLNMFIKHGYDKIYPRLVFIILGEKQDTYDSQKIIRASNKLTFDPTRDIYDLNQLYDMLVKQGDAAKFVVLNTALVEELSEELQPYLAGYYQAGQRLQKLFIAHDITATTGAAVLDPYGITRATFSDPAKLNDRLSAAALTYLAAQFAIDHNWIAGDTNHIYARNVNDTRLTEWRRSIDGAYELIVDLFDVYKQVTLVMPADVSVDDLATVIVERVDGDALLAPIAQATPDDIHRVYFLTAQNVNDFKVACHHWILNEPLYYAPTRTGIYFLFLAAEIYNALRGTSHLIDIVQADNRLMQACAEGTEFLAAVFYARFTPRNHRDYLYFRGGNVQVASAVLAADVAGMQEALNEYHVRRGGNSPSVTQLPNKIFHSPPSV